jgi:hypothetical protein
MSITKTGKAKRLAIRSAFLYSSLTDPDRSVYHLYTREPMGHSETTKKATPLPTWPSPYSPGSMRPKSGPFPRALVIWPLMATDPARCTPKQATNWPESWVDEPLTWRNLQEWMFPVWSRPEELDLWYSCGQVETKPDQKSVGYWQTG